MTSNPKQAKKPPKKPRVAKAQPCWSISPKTPPGYVPIVNTPDGSRVNTGFGLTIRAGISGKNVVFPVLVTIKAQAPIRVSYDSDSAVLMNQNATVDFIAYHDSSGYQTHILTFIDSHVLTLTESKTVETEGTDVVGPLVKAMSLPTQFKKPTIAKKPGNPKSKKGAKRK